MLTLMASDQNKRRQQKAARKRHRDTRKPVTEPFATGRVLGDGWSSFDGLDRDPFDLQPPPDSLLDTSECPVASRCEGCGAPEQLTAVTSAFTGKVDQWNVACATLCQRCDGRSFLTLLGPEGLQAAMRRHAHHKAA